MTGSIKIYKWRKKNYKEEKQKRLTKHPYKSSVHVYVMNRVELKYRVLIRKRG